MKEENLTIDLSCDLKENLRKAATSLGHIGKRGFDCDGSNMLDDYVMFDVYDIMLKAGSVNFDKRYLGGETVATFRSNHVYDELCKQNYKYEGYNPECPKHKDLGEVHKGECSCHNPHYLGNFMPYPGGGYNSNHSTKRRTCANTSLQELHNSCHNENPFRMLMDIQEYFELSQSERKSSEKEYIRAMHLADEDPRFKGNGFGNAISDHGFYTQFESFDKFVETLCFDDFVESDYFKQGYELRNSPVNNVFKEQDYYDKTMECIKARTEKILKIPGIKEKLAIYLSN